MLMTGFPQEDSYLGQKRGSNADPGAIKTPFDSRPKEGVALPSVSQTRSAVHTAGGAVQKEAIKGGVAAAVKVVKNESVPETEVSQFKESSNAPS